MAKLWIVLGNIDAAGWDALRKDYQDEKVEIIHLDPKVWAIIEADEPPSGYEGLRSEVPADGMYIDPNGSPLYVVGGKAAATAQAVIEALGAEAREAMAETGNAEAALERIGRVY